MKLREYQNNIAIQAANKLTAFGCCYLSMECRTGKTLTALYAADKFNAKSVLFITKLKAIPSVKNDYIALQPSFKLEVVNFESSHKVTGKYDLVIIDEAHSLGAYPKQAYTGDKDHLRRFARALFVRYTFTRKLLTAVSPILGMQQITVEKL